MKEQGNTQDRSIESNMFLWAKFPAGRIVATHGASDLLGHAPPEAGALKIIHRHLSGDWGDLGDEDKAANDAALLHGGRIFSAYHIGGEKVWVITEADRSATTFLLPSEY